MIRPEVISEDPNQIPFEQLFIEFYDTSVRRGRKILGNPEDAEDAAQETFTKLWQMWLRTQVDRARIGGWIKVTNIHDCIDALRYQGRRPSIPLEEGWSNPLTEQGNEEGIAMLLEDTQAALGKASARESLAFRLAVFGDVHMAEGANIMGTSVAIFKATVHRAKKKVRGELKGAYG